MNKSHPILQTSRLYLRPLRTTDAPQIQQLFPHWEIVQFLATAIPWPYPEDGAQKFLEITLPKNESGQQYDWAITLKANNDDGLIGIISLYPANKDDSRGFWLGAAYHNRGLMKEATYAINEFAFNEVGMSHLMLNNAEPNRASHRLKEISGARIIAVTEDSPFIGGKFRRIQWLLTREDWEIHRHFSI